MQLTVNQKQLFLLDGIGALVSAFFLGFVLVAFESLVGMPKNTLFVLAALPCLFAVYSFGCYFFLKQNRRRFLRGIALANLLYCFITMGLLYVHYQSLTFLGWTYFILELFIIGILIGLELKHASDK